MTEAVQLTQWVRLCQEGNPDGFRLIYQSEKNRLFSVALRLCGSSQDAEDCLQEAFIKMYRAIPSFRFESSFSTWMYRIVVNTCLNHLERSPASDSLDENLIPSPGKDPDGSLEQIERAIHSLSEANRVVFILFEIEGFSHSEISEMLGITEGTSKSRLSRAKEELRLKLSMQFNPS